MNPSDFEVPQERILRGNDHWWFLGPGGVARLRANHLTPEGTLRPAAAQHLREAGLFNVPALRAYAVTVLTSTDCNLGCGYCFQNIGQDDKGGNRPPRIAHARLTSETIGAILGFASRRMAQAELDKLHILLFGGEPLLNPRGCVELLARAADYGLVSASMTSNLTLLTPNLARQLADLRLRSVQVTFDGDREDHDKIRVRRSNGGTFDTIVRNLARATEAAPTLRWTLRVNVSHLNVDGISNLVRRLAGELDTSRCTIYFAKVGDARIGYQNDLQHTQNQAAEFAQWKFQALEAGFVVSRPGAHVPCQTCSHRDGRYGAVVSADGTLASCWDTAGKPEWQVGTVDDGYLPSSQTRARWVSCVDTYDRPADGSFDTFNDVVDAAMLDYLSKTGRL